MFLHNETNGGVMLPQQSRWNVVYRLTFLLHGITVQYSFIEKLTNRNLKISLQKY